MLIKNQYYYSVTAEINISTLFSPGLSLPCMMWEATCEAGKLQTLLKAIFQSEKGNLLKMYRMRLCLSARLKSK